MTDRIGSDRLNRLREQLSEHDVKVLRRLIEHRYLQTDQLARFEFAERPTEIAAKRAAHRTLKRLRVLGLIAMLERRVGGQHRGSSAAIWTLTDTGLRLAAEEQQPRRRIAEPTLIFLRHDLAVADLHLGLLDAASNSGSTVERLQLEPDCWRRYVGPLGALTTIKPDLALDLDSDEFEASYLFEVDRATEPPRRILAKSLQYQEYFHSKDSSRSSDLLPLVVWTLPDEKRRQQIARYLIAANGINKRLFRAVVPSEIPALIAGDESIGRLPVPDAGTEARDA